MNYDRKLSDVIVYRDTDLQIEATPQSVINLPRLQKVAVGAFVHESKKPSIARSLIRILTLLLVYGSVLVFLVLALAGRLR